MPINYKDLLEESKRLYERQEVLADANLVALYDGYTFVDIHCLESAGKLAKANVT